MNTATRPATPTHLPYILNLQRRFSNQVGFLPAQALESYVEHGMIQLAEENSDPAGYILWRHRLTAQPQLASIVQAAVQMDAQRRHHGLALLEEIKRQAIINGQLGIQAICRVGIEANEFWRAAGFKNIAITNCRNARDRPLIVWRLPLVTRLPTWFIDLPKFIGRNNTKPRHTNRREWSRHDEHAIRSLYRASQPQAKKSNEQES
jgi:N-acetylglutamate synthase-like GNAT family acetyltransferase